ncbi:MAG: hypothetical protein ACM3ON_11480 [Chloroflexota bacterium]
MFLFLVLFSLYSVSPLKSSFSGSGHGLTTQSTNAVVSVLFAEQILGMILNAQDQATADDSADDETLLKKKRALLRSLIFFVVLIVLARFSYRLGISLIVVPPAFLRSSFEHRLRCGPPQLYSSKHSGLSPPYHILA